MSARTILVVEDGSEYTEAFRRLAVVAGEAPSLVRAGNAVEARRALAGHAVGSVFVDMVFDRTPPERLAGDLLELTARYGGDRRRAEQHLARDQGFYVVSELAPLLESTVRVVLAWDFSSEPDRLAALQQRVPGLSGFPEGTPITRLLEMLLGQADR